MFPADHLTITAIAAHLRASRWTVGRLIDAGAIATVQGPAGPLIPTTEYLTWIAGQAVSPGQKDGDMSDAMPTLHPFPEVAEKYGFSLRSLNDGARQRKFAHTRVGVKRYFTDSQIEAFLAARTVAADRDTSMDGARARLERRQRRAAPAA